MHTLFALWRLSSFPFPPYRAIFFPLFAIYRNSRKWIRKMRWNFYSTWHCTTIESSSKKEFNEDSEDRERIAWIVLKQIHCNPHRRGFFLGRWKNVKDRRIELAVCRGIIHGSGLVHEALPKGPHFRALFRCSLIHRLFRGMNRLLP